MGFTSFLVHNATFTRNLSGLVGEFDKWGNPIVQAETTEGIACKWVRKENYAASVHSGTTVVDNFLYVGMDFPVRPGDTVSDVMYKLEVLLPGSYLIESVETPQGFGGPHHQKIKLKGVVPSE